MSQATTSLRISMPEVARLARVKRPVVSMWRSRAAGTDQLFPAPLTSDRGQETFDALEVAEWLTSTGRGNNPSVHQDVAAFATVHGASPREERAVFEALTSLVCLGVITGRPLGELDSDDLLDRADEHDPDDHYLYAELGAVADRLPQIARYADLLADAAISPQEAFERLMSDRFRSGLTEHAATAVADRALSLVAKVALALVHRNGQVPIFVDPSPGSSDLLLAIAKAHGDRGLFEVMTPPGEMAAARLVRRRLRVHDLYREDVLVDNDGAFSVDRPVTHVAQFPTPAAPRISDVQILTAIENIVLQMDDSQQGVILAPASALSDGFGDRAVEGLRADMIRAGHVRAIVRLPRGLVPARSRQALAIWVLGPAHHNVDAVDRLTVAADLSNVSMTDDAVDALVTDLTTAIGGIELVRAHAFTFARPVPTRALLAATGSLVELAPALRRSLRPNSANLLLPIQEAAAVVSEHGKPPALPGLRMNDSAESSRSDPVTIGSLLRTRQLQVVPGNRVDDADIRISTGAPVIGVPELTGESAGGVRAVDQFLLAGKYDVVRRTEPGDVVFCTSPRPAAHVDREGSAVVVYPARVLRLDPNHAAGLLPDVLAADVNALPEHAREWKMWPVRRVPEAQRPMLQGALSELQRTRADLLRRLTHLDRLTDLITDGVASGALALQPPASPATKGRQRAAAQEG